MRVVVTGASGQLGSTVLFRLAEAGHEVWGWSGSLDEKRGPFVLRAVDLRDEPTVLQRLEEADPEVVIHAAAVSSAEAVRRDPVFGRAVNTEATARLAAWCDSRGRRLIYTSTDLVFDGTRSWYREEDAAEPILEYGRTKRDAEPAVLAIPRGLVARMSLMYGPSRSGRPSYYERTIAGLREEWREPFSRMSSALRSPWRVPRRFWSGWPSRTSKGCSTSPARNGSVAMTWSVARRWPSDSIPLWCVRIARRI